MCARKKEPGISHFVFAAYSSQTTHTLKHTQTKKKHFENSFKHTDDKLILFLMLIIYFCSEITTELGDRTYNSESVATPTPNTHTLTH